MKIKKIILVAIAVLSIAFGATTIASAGDHGDRDDKARNTQRTIGEVTNVDAPQQILEIKDQNGKVMRFKITPETNMEFEDNGMLSWEEDATMLDLKNGQWVKIKYYGTGEIKAAKDVNIYKVKSR